MKPLLFLLLAAAAHIISANAQWQPASTAAIQKVRCLYSRGNNLWAGGIGAAQLPKDPTDIFVSSNGITFNGMLIDENSAVTIHAIVMNQNQKVVVGTLANGLYQGVGAAWSIISGITPAAQSVQALAEKGGVFYAGTNTNGIYRSTDNGVTWSQTTGVSHIVRAILPTTGTNIFAATEVGGIYRSADGMTWTPVNTGLPAVSRSVFTLCEANGRIYAGTETDIYFSTNNGNTWNALNTGFINVRSVVSDGTALFAGMINSPIPGVFRSTDLGQSWQDASKGLTNKNVFSLAVFGANIYAGTDQGVWRAGLSDFGGGTGGAAGDTVKAVIFGGTEIDLFVKDLPVSFGCKWTFFHPEGGVATPIPAIPGQNNFIKLSASQDTIRWRAPFLDADIARFNGSDRRKIVYVTCEVTDFLNGDKKTLYYFEVTVRPTFVRPNDAAVDIDFTTPNYTWRAVPRAQRYLLQVKAKSSSYPLIGDITNDTIMPAAPSLALLEDNEYSWRVRMNDSAGLILGERSFTTKALPLEATTDFPTGGATICDGDTIRLRVTANRGYRLAGNKPYSFSWKLANGQDIPSDIIRIPIQSELKSDYSESIVLQPKSAIDVKCTVTDKRVNQQTVNFSIKIGSASQTTIQTNTGKTTLCAGSSLTLTLPETYDQYRWIKGVDTVSTSPFFEIKSGGTYRVIARKSGSCDAVATIDIEEKPVPAPIVQGASVVCVGSSDVQYSFGSGQQGDVVSWEITEGVGLVNAAGFTQSGKLGFTGKGLVKIRATVTNSAGCTGVSQEFPVTVGDSIRVTLPGATSFCTGFSTVLNGGVQGTYQWFRDNVLIQNESGQTLTVKTPGRYFAVISAGLCKGSSNAVEVAELPLPSADVSRNAATGELSVNEGVAWQWFSGRLPDTVRIAGATGKTFQPDTMTGDFSVRVVGANGCENIGFGNVPPRATLGVFRLTDAAGSSAIQMQHSKTLQDVRTVELRVSSSNSSQAAQLGVAFYRVALRWHSRSLGMSAPPQAVVIANDTATMEYDLPASKAAADGTADTYSFLALTGGAGSAEITPKITALTAAKTPVTTASIDVNPAVVSIDSVRLVPPSRAQFIIAAVKPNPAAGEISVEISAVTGGNLPEIPVYLAALDGRKILDFARTGGGFYAADCSALPTGTYTIVAGDGASKQLITVQIGK